MNEGDRKARVCVVFITNSERHYGRAIEEHVRNNGDKVFCGTHKVVLCDRTRNNRVQ